MDAILRRLTVIGLVVLCGPSTPAIAEFDGRLPISPGERVDPDGNPPRYSELLWHRYGPGFVIYWDHLLDTPRYISPRSRLTIVPTFAGSGGSFEGYGDNDPTREVIRTSILQFVDENQAFFGLTSAELSTPEIHLIGNLWLFSCRQRVEDVYIRGTSLRVVVRPDGSLFSAKAFLLRNRPLSAPVFSNQSAVDAAIEELKSIRGLGYEIDRREKQFIFPRWDLTSITPIWNARVHNQHREPHEVFIDHASGQLIEERRFIFELGVVDGQINGKFPNPDPTAPGFFFQFPESFSDSAQFPVKNTRVEGVVGASQTDENGFFRVPVPDSGGSINFFLETGACAPGIEPVIADGFEFCQPGPANFRPTLQIWTEDGSTFRPGNVVGSNLVNSIQPGVFFNMQANPNLSVIQAAQFMSFHHIQHFMEESNERFRNSGVTIGSLGVPLKVVISSQKTPGHLFYSPSETDPLIVASYLIEVPARFGHFDKQFLTPTFLAHEFAHHLIFTHTRALQGFSLDCFPAGRRDRTCIDRIDARDFRALAEASIIEGLADAIAAYHANDPRIGFFGDSTFQRSGPLSFDISGNSPALANRLNDPSREAISRLFWEIHHRFISRAEGPDKRLMRERATGLLYRWMGLQRTPDGTSRIFDMSQIILDELLDIDRDGSNLKGKPNPLAIEEAFNEYIIELIRHPEIHNMFIRGDADQNLAVEITDAIFTLQFLFLGDQEEAPRCFDAMDTDNNETLEITDAVFTLQFLFLGGPEPQEPFNNCGPDTFPVAGLEVLFCATPACPPPNR